MTALVAEQIEPRRQQWAVSRSPDDPAALLARYRAVRSRSDALAGWLSPEDQSIQSMPDASPTKWHLAHTTWFFETAVLRPNQPSLQPYDPRFDYLFNSYYEALGARHPRPQRGLLSRPSSAEIAAYRAHVDEAMSVFLAGSPASLPARQRFLIELGLAHEEQHQELLLTDIKHAFYANPLRPAYRALAEPAGTQSPPLGFVKGRAGLISIGHDAYGFAFDNEGPRHSVYLQPYRLATRLTTCGEYLAFIADGGYRRPEFWLSEGWAEVQAKGWEAPLYWSHDAGDDWTIFTLGGSRALAPHEPVIHVSFFEAAAYAAWAGKRLPTEFEWESSAADHPVDGNQLATDRLHPIAAEPGQGLTQLFGDAWEWTRSAYGPYPGFKPFEGITAEYNGKFMIGQMVLRGGSCLTPPDHLRATYRNFFPPSARWQASGIRLAEDS